jgi:PadR family transcriptional regulator, regulatory protein PadR
VGCQQEIPGHPFLLDDIAAPQYLVYNVLMTAKHVGELEHMILLAIVRLGRDAYGMSILRELDERADRKVSRGALYLVLERMVQKGYLDSRMGEPTSERGGRAKRFFELTGAGKEALRVSGRSLLALWDGLESLLEEGR